MFLLFLFPLKTTAALTLPTTACDAELIRLETVFPLSPGISMQKEDGTKAFKYGPDNNSFVSLQDDVLTFNIQLLFDLDSSPSKVIKFLAFNNNCINVTGNAFTNIPNPGNSLTYNRTTTETKFNNGDSFFPSLGLPRFIWLEVWDGKNNTTFASYSYLVDVNDPKNPTGSIAQQPQQSQEPSGKRPVLIIPGIMGSKLYYDNQLVWVDPNEALDKINDYFLQNLTMSNNGESVKTIVAKSVIDEMRIVNKKLGIDLRVSDSFKSLVQGLMADGYNTNSNYFYFPYDWRLNLDINNSLLDKKVTDIKNQTGFKKVDIIAHSMGGLVTEGYIKEFGKGSINKLIFVGTPHLGAPKSAKALLEGDIDIPFGLLNYDTMKALSKNMPSVYELLPNQKYFETYQGYLKLSGSFNPPLADYSSTMQFLKDKKLNEYLINKAEGFFNKKIYDLDLSGIETYNIVGCGKGTQAAYSFFPGNEHIFSTGYTSGDGTVPMVSAQYVKVDADKKFYVKKIKHAELPSKTKDLILGIINNSIPSSNDISNNSTFCGFKGKSLTWRSPVTIHIYDQTGNHAGPTSGGGFENSLIGVDYEIINGEKFIFIPTDDGNTYSIQATGDGTGTFDLVLSDIDNGTVLSSTVYNDVAITGASQITVNLSGQVSLGAQPLQASSVLFGQALNDSTPPVTQIQINGTMPISSYTGSARVELTSADDNSGILQIKYSADGVNYQIYSSPVSIDSIGNIEFKYYAIDRAGNNEKIKKQIINISAFSGGGGLILETPSNPEPIGKVLGEKKENSELQKKEEQNISKIRDGSIVLDSIDNRTVYIIGTGGKKYGFTSQEVFWGLGYSFANLVTADLTDCELGGLVDSVDRPHPDGSLVIEDAGTVWFINYKKRLGFPSLNSLIQYDVDLKNIIKANRFDLDFEKYE